MSTKATSHSDNISISISIADYPLSLVNLIEINFPNKISLQQILHLSKSFVRIHFHFRLAYSDIAFEKYPTFSIYNIFELSEI